MGLKSQRKGRAAEHEVRDLALAFGLNARTHDIYEPLDVSIDGEPYEVKRRAEIFKQGYNAMHSGAAGIIFRADRERWLIAIPFEDWLKSKAGETNERQLPTVQQANDETSKTPVPSQCKV